nr:MAG TPA: hypothetical protein [Caudoviricetes sp.]
MRSNSLSNLDIGFLLTKYIIPRHHIWCQEKKKGNYFVYNRYRNKIR